MAIRTTSSLVSGIIEVDDSISLTPFISTASNLVDRLLTGSVDADNDRGFDNATLELIERWLAAHFYAIRDQRVDTEKAGPVSQKFQYKVEIGLSVTIYGQQAMMLDTSGALASLDNQLKNGAPTKVGVSFIGGGDDD